MEPTAERRLRRARRGAPGDQPGILTTSGPTEPASLRLYRFDAGAFEDSTSLDDLPRYREAGGRVWLDVTGMRDPDTVAAVGRAVGLHALPLEDVLDPGQRPKVEEYDEHLFVIMRTLAMGARMQQGRIAMFVGRDLVVTFHEEGETCLEPVRERLRQDRGKLRKRGADYLAYSIIDSIIDHYFPAMEGFDDRLEDIEDAVLDPRTTDPIALARNARSDLQVVRHTVWPARDVLAYLLREEVELIGDDTRLYLRDCYDHLAQLHDMVEASREVAASLLEVYLSSVSLESNRAMRLLTVIATIFIPITFITGVYGMNFDPRRSPLNMPEIIWYWGYPFSLGIMAAITLGLLVYFRRRGWLGKR